MSVDEEKLFKIIYLKLSFEAPSDWTTREYIGIIDEYLMERLPIILNNALEPYGLEAAVMEGMTECDLGLSPCSSDTLVVNIYESGSNKPLFRAVYYRRIGENTYEFFLKRIVK